MLHKHADVGRTARTTVSASAPPALPSADEDTPSCLPVQPTGSGLSSAGEQAARSPLPPAAAFYSEALGWPVAIEADEVVVECGEVLDVVAMPIGLASEVNHQLSLHRITAPIMEVRGAGRSTWAFFCDGRRVPREARTIGLLSLHGVVHFGVGVRVPLPPSPTCNGPELGWVVEPQLDGTGSLPHWASLMSCVLKAVGR